jgi:YesN/AraC family two-component response regulator
MDEQLYLDESLTLSKLAQKVNVSANYLSQVINENFEKNFYGYF